MKKILTVLLLVFAILACKQEPKDYVTLSGKILNPHDSKIITVFTGKDTQKDIKLNDDGTFSDTLKIKEAGNFTFKHGEEYGQVYLKNNEDMSFTLDNEMFDETLIFKGVNADRNNFSIQNSLLAGKYLNEAIDLPENKFNEAINNFKGAFETLKTEYSSLDEAFFNEQNENVNKIIKNYTDYYQSKLAMRSEFRSGSPSPSFDGYENYKGGTTSLADLKGKYVYADIWATWCGPCKAEIPSLKKLEKSYHGKNIEFVSISVDDGRGYKGDATAAKEGWKKMIVEKDLTGVQLITPEGFKSKFIRDYKINSIPRFILIDPQGNIVNADAPRPSSSALTELFDFLKI